MIKSGRRIAVRELFTVESKPCSLARPASRGGHPVHGRRSHAVVPRAWLDGGEPCQGNTATMRGTALRVRLRHAPSSWEWQDKAALEPGTDARCGGSLAVSQASETAGTGRLGSLGPLAFLLAVTPARYYDASKHRNRPGRHEIASNGVFARGPSPRFWKAVMTRPRFCIGSNDGSMN